MTTHFTDTENRYLILGLPFDAINLDQAVNIIEEKIATKEKCFLSTPNVNFAISAVNDEQFFNSIMHSDLSVADGMPLVWLARLMNLPIKERVAGSDIFKKLSEIERETPIKVFFFGGEPLVAQEAHKRLNETSKGMISVGYYDPGFVSISEMSSKEIIDKINSTEPDFLVVALGAKKGQTWIMQNKNLLNATVISHLGAVVNFVAEKINRAPVKWQKFGLEWLWRIRQEPKLWKRYLSDGVTLLILLMRQQIPFYIYDFYYRRKVQNNQPQVRIDKNTVYLSGAFFDEGVKCFRQELENFIDENTAFLKIDMSQVDYVGLGLLADLVILKGVLIDNHGSLSLENIPKHVARLISLSGLDITKIR